MGCVNNFELLKMSFKPLNTTFKVILLICNRKNIGHGATN